MDIAIPQRCKLCSNERLTILDGVKRCSPDLKEFSIRYYLCEKCASVFHDQLDFLPVDYYGSSYFNAPLRIASLSKSLDFILEHIGDVSGLKALDVGCSNGNFMLLLEKSGFGVRGIELSSQGRSEAVSRGLKVYDSLEFIKNDRFQLITFNHVIEHIDRPAEFVAEHIQFLDKECVLYIEVPSIEVLAKGSGSSFSNLYPNHIFHFSENSIYELAKILRCTVVAVQHHNYLNYPSMMCLLRKSTAAEYQASRFSKHLNYENEEIENKVNHIQAQSSDWPHVVIWGCSDDAYQIINRLSPQSREKLILVDSSVEKIGKSLLGHEVRAPTYLKQIDNFIIAIAPTAPRIIQSIKGAAVELVNCKNHSFCNWGNLGSQ